DKMSDKERYDKTEENSKKIVKKAEDGKDVECTVRSFYDGADYYLYTYFKIKDVRIVYAPPRSIGIYGGDEDNWMWPRHTGDFSFLRAYVAPDGKSAEFAEENIPYAPKKFLPFANKPLADGELTMVLGYPGSTRRYRTSYAIDYYVNQMYPQSIQRYKDLLAILESVTENYPEAGIKVASMIQGLNNGLKNNIGMLDGLKKADLLGQKIAEEAALRDFMDANPELKKKYGTVLDEIGAQYDDYEQYAELSSIAGWMTYSCSALRSAYTIYKWSNEHTKKNDLDRDPGYQDRDEERIKKGLELADLRYDEGSDKDILDYFLMKCTTLPENQQLDALEPIADGLVGEALAAAVSDFVENLYAGTMVTNKDERMKMFAMKKKDLMALNDPMIEFASRLEAQREELEDRSDAFAGAVERLRPQLMALRQAHGGKLLYPDANGTMRLSIGDVKGYKPRDAVYYYYETTLAGVVEKNTGVAPFNCPEALIDLYESKDFGDYADKKINDVPVCLLTTNDSTGGNSGSPILNGKGELIGTLFDGNFESMASDFLFMPALTRSIHCESRYILFIIDKFAGADELLNELTVHGGGNL
ncbi:MAG: S46 family peptidase, partial [bacterium]